LPFPGGIAAIGCYHYLLSIISGITLTIKKLKERAAQYGFFIEPYD
jgi:hypothetical protein